MKTHEGKLLSQWLTDNGKSPEVLGRELGVSKQNIYYHISKEVIADSFKHKLEKSNINIFDKSVKIDNSIKKPVFDIYGRAGFTSLTNTMDNFQITNYVSVPGYEDCIGWIRVKGDSMSPFLKSGDYIALKRVNIDMIFFGHVYFIEFNGEFAPEPVVKYIRKSQTKGFWTLRSHNDKYEDTDIPISSVKAVYTVKGGVIEIQ